MKKKSIFCMFSMLFLFISANSFAFNQPVNCEPKQELAFSFLDTVIVYDYVKVPLYAEKSSDDNTSPKEIGKEILVRFSNGLVYDYIVSSQNLTKELREKGADHIYNAVLGDVVVVRVVVTHDSRRIAEFVANLSLR